MKTRFDILFLDDAWQFLQRLDVKMKAKVTFNLKRSQVYIDPELFKKLNNHVWEFRTEYANQQIRLLAFWSPKERALVVCTHGFFKQKQKIPSKEIFKAEQIRSAYLKRHGYERE